MKNDHVSWMPYLDMATIQKMQDDHMHYMQRFYKNQRVYLLTLFERAGITVENLLPTKKIAK